jgi:hypothetical protein
MEPIVKILPLFDKTHPDFVGRTRYMHVGGGLGDIFNHLYQCPCYPDLETLKEGERAFVFVSSHNSCAWELFAWHRNADKITLADVGIQNILYSEREDDRRRKEEIGFISDCDHRWPIPGPVIYYPPPEDVKTIADMKALGKYVVFALTASDIGRSIRKEQGEQAAKICQELGYKVVLTGRNYQFNDHGNKAQRREEIRLETPGVVDLIDKLTVPGTAQLIEGAAAVFTCHSALCHIAWHLRKPTFVLYDDFAKGAYFTNKFEGYSFGAAFPGNDHASLNEYTGDRFINFIKGVPLAT